MQAIRKRALGLCRDSCHLPTSLRLPTCKSCCSTCIKVVLVLVNFVFLVCGWMLVVLGVWLHIYQDSIIYTYLLKDSNSTTTTATTSSISSTNGHSNSDSGGGGAGGGGSGGGGSGSGGGGGAGSSRTTEAVISLETVPFVLMGVGGFLASMSFLGCCGACAESICFLGFYTLLTFMIVVGEVIVGTISSDIIDQTSKRLLKSMQYQVQTRYNVTAQRSNNTMTDSYRLTVAWDSLQTELQCCGAAGPHDYLRSSWFNHTNDFSGVFIPSTCCSLLNDDPRKPMVKDENICQVEAILIGRTDQPMTNIHAQGCHEAVTKWFRRYETIVICLLCAIILIQITNFVFACFLMTWVRKKQSDYSWCEKDEFE